MVAPPREMVLPDSNTRTLKASEWSSMLVVVLTLTTLTATMTSLTTYAGLFVQYINGSSDTKKSGYYAGWIGSSFLIGRLLTSYAWGVFADRFGRRPVFIVGTISMTVCSVGLGISSSFVEAFTWRFLLGTTMGVWSMGRVVIPELLRPEHVVVGMGFIPGSKAIGCIVGPLCGGFLVQPAERWPTVFSPTGLFGRYPFLLPNLVFASMSLIVLILVLFFLPETLVKRDNRSEHVFRSHSNLEAPSETTADYHHLEAPPRTAKLASTREESTPNNTTKLRSRRYSLVSVNPVASKATASKGPSGSLEQSETHTNTPEGHAEEDEEEDVEEDDLGDGDEALSVPLKAEKGRICPDHEEGSNFRALCGLSRGQGAGRAPASQADANLCGVNGLLTSRYMGLLFALEALNSVMRIGWEEIYPLWALTPVDDGGLHWSVAKVGKVFVWVGIGMLVFQFVLFPVLVRTVGIMRLLRVTGVLGFVMTLTTPDIQRMGWSGSESVLVAVLLLMVLDINGSVWSTALALSITNAVPTQRRGQVIGVFTVVESCGRAFSPALMGTLLSWSLERSTSSRGHGVVDYHFVFVLESLLMAIMVLIGWRTFTLEKITIPVETREQRLRSCEQSL